MCGIGGILDLGVSGPPAVGALQAMAGAMIHRGPDEAGIYRDRALGLVHTRLSIIDLATGQQPMSDAAGDLWIVFNGEIFNYLELRAELEAAGHRFRTRSDTEVVIESFRAWGTDAFARFDGQFAIALWDAPRRELVLARDRLGVRPLHWTEHEGRLLFASEVRALAAATPDRTLDFDPLGLAQTFTFWSPVAPRTAFAGISEVEPGSAWIIGPAARRKVRYWEPAFPGPGEPVSESLAGAVKEIGPRLERAVELRLLRADVQVGAYLSGGLDSSLVAAMASRIRGRPLTTFSVRFADPAFDEGRYQELMAATIGSEHHALEVTGRDIAEAFPDVVRHAERPLLRTAATPMFLLSRLVRDRGIKVVLTGEGADELFGGYDLFREARVRRFWSRVPASELRPLLFDRLYPYLDRGPSGRRTMARAFFGKDLHRAAEPGFGHRPRWRATAAVQRLFAPELRQVMAAASVDTDLLEGLPPAFGRWGPLEQDQYLELRTLLAGYLLSAQGDRVLMANSVEGRFPFLDTEVVDSAMRLASRHKLRGLEEKVVLKEIARDLVPAEIIARPKQPYRAPDAASFAGPDRPDWVDAVLSPDALARHGLFDVGAVTSLWRKCRAAFGPDSTLAPGAFSNTDNMSLVGVLSTSILADGWRRGGDDVSIRFQTVVDRVDRPVRGSTPT